ncbi:hypothetical protein OG887_35935 [Streptomyces sp. NBC_00053]|uniref:hypothetical protein n=1 Tax=unclassified Streptomyces TaxID=2593676 RepID=UPI00224D3DC5|nr:MULTISPECIES: hypothetical protein [unclassified Streptomyces]MCX5504724.1 hypothetical protein [Streptomyces sp. NBC_00052]MCX5546739.1 hypothetical protein [Streptomyces sp. NBC_00051]WSC33584.1 hypothetical protein OG902_06015 [Streptomyces sp. NBC_01768]
MGGITFTNNTITRLDRKTAFAAQAEDLCPAPGATTAVRAVATASPYTTPLFAYHGSTGAVIEGNNFDNGLNLRAELDSTEPAQVTSDEVVEGRDNVLSLLPSTTFTSSNPAVAEVDQRGTVTARAPVQPSSLPAPPANRAASRARPSNCTSARTPHHLPAPSRSTWTPTRGPSYAIGPTTVPSGPATPSNSPPPATDSCGQTPTAPTTSSSPAPRRAQAPRRSG